MIKYIEQSLLKTRCFTSMQNVVWTFLFWNPKIRNEDFHTNFYIIFKINVIFWKCQYIFEILSIQCFMFSLDNYELDYVHIVYTIMKYHNLDF